MEATRPDRLYVTTWLALLGLTGVLVLLSRLGQGPAVWGLLLITPFKAWLVFQVFMHLMDQELLPRVALLVTLGTLIIFFALLFSDAAFR